MAGGAKLFGHPIHQMLIVFPLGLLAMAVIFDIIRLIAGTPLGVPAYYMIAAGVISGLVAAVFGLIDWLGVPSRTRAKSVGLWHALGNVVVLILFAASWWIDSASVSTLARMRMHRAHFRGGRRPADDRHAPRAHRSLTSALWRCTC